MKHLEDDEMIELSLRVTVKLNDLTDQEFAEKLERLSALNSVLA